MYLFLNVVLPTISVFILGYILQKWKKANVKSIASVSIYIFVPCLVFKTFYETDLNIDYGLILLFEMYLLVIIIIINRIVSYFMNFDKGLQNGFILSTAFMNAGNYGAPVILFAFGEKAFAYSVMFLSIHSIIMNFFGVYYASKGTEGVFAAVKSVWKMPATYAIIIAIFLNQAHVNIPESLESRVEFLSEAAIPIMMVVLGMQLANISFEGFDWGKVFYASSIRLLVSPLLALIFILAIPLDPMLEKVLIISAAMPSAATTTLYAVEFNARPNLVSTITLVTTVISVFTLTILLNILT